MAVNYGLGGFKNGAAYCYGFVNSAFTVSIGIIDKFFEFTEAIDFGSNLGFTQSAGVLTADLKGYYFVKYSVTTSAASGDNLQLGLVINGLSASEGRQFLYSNNGDEFTTNSTSIIKFSGISTLQLAIKNISNEADVDIEGYSISVFRIGELETFSDQFLAGTCFISSYFDNRSTPITISYASTNTFYPITGQTLTIVSSQNIKATGTDNDTLEILMDGFYMLDASITTEGSSNDDLTLGILKNGDVHTDSLSYPQQNFNSKGGTLWQTGLNGIFELKKGDTLMLALKNNSDTTGTTKVVSINNSLSRIGNI